MKVNSWRRKLEKRTRGGVVEYPVGTLLFYGPDNRRASKVVAGIVHDPASGRETLLKKWFSDEMDVRMDPRIGREVERFLDEHKVRRVATTAGLAGCPHEEGIDYPDDEICPQCPFWADRDRWDEAGKPSPPAGLMGN